MIKKMIKKFLVDFKNFFNELSLVCKYLFIIGILSFSAISISIFHIPLDEVDNLVVIRTVFSSISGYMLEKSTKTCTSDPKLVRNKVVLVGGFSIIATLVVICAYIMNINSKNPSLILVTNLLFSSIGFLTSASNDLFRK
jgi:hypothetical protein